MDFCIFKTPIGNLKLVEMGKKLIEIDFTDELEISTENQFLLDVKRQLEEYFLGRRKVFDVVLNLSGTDFQKTVWKELLKIPYGETRSYKEIAIAIGNEKAVRAVGNANNKNRIPIIIPCHRVIGSNGKLVGYDGGLLIKENLLNLEKNNIK